MPNTEKKEAIRKAYGEYWGQVKDKVDDDGYSSMDNSNFYPNVDWHPNKNHLWRPKSLQGIENNNGWIRIESEEDLPLSGDLYLCKISHNAWDSEDYIYYLMKDFHKSVPHKLKRALEYTHFQPIVKPEKPIY